jgi:hypothetical protein|tara:strand:- start:1485 stop:1715 length:231 start_codon:yes stop_codon:yes gene_type:complete
MADWIKDVTDSPDFEKGGLHKALGVPEGEDIPCGKMRSAWKKAKASGNKDMIGKLTFAFNTGSKSCAPSGWGSKDK